MDRSSPFVACLLMTLLVAAIAGCVERADGNGDNEPPPAGPAPSDSEFGATRVLFHAPSPWFVEGIAVHGDRGFTGTALGATGSPLPLQTYGQPSRIYVFDVIHATLLETILIEGEDATVEHGIAGLTTDGDGRLYAADIQQGILRFTETDDGWTQEVYATIPDLLPCLIHPAPCSPTPDDQPGLPNDMAFDTAGNLYVSDSFQATVWRIPPGTARQAEPWYQHESLDRAFGPNGIRVDADRNRLILAVCCPDTLAVGPVDRASRLVTLALPDPGTAAPTDLYVLDNGEGADGIELNATGAIYIASNFGTKVIVVEPDGTLARTITNEDLVGEASFDFPASITFHDATRTMVITNYAYTNASPADDQRYVLEVFVDDVGAPRIRPMVP